MGQVPPSQVRSVLQQLLPSAIVTSSDRAVVVWADEQDHEKARQAVEQFTKPATRDESTRVFPIAPERANARTIYENLGGELQERWRYR